MRRYQPSIGKLMEKAITQIVDSTGIEQVGNEDENAGKSEIVCGTVSNILHPCIRLPIMLITRISVKMIFR